MTKNAVNTTNAHKTSSQNSPKRSTSPGRYLLGFSERLLCQGKQTWLDIAVSDDVAHNLEQLRESGVEDADALGQSLELVAVGFVVHVYQPLWPLEHHKLECTIRRLDHILPRVP